MTRTTQLRSRSFVGALAGAALVTGLVCAPVASAFAAEPIVVDGMNIDANGSAVVNNVEREDIASGLVHVSYDRLDPDGWQQISILKAELSDETVKMSYLDPEVYTGAGATVTELVDRAGAIAGVNLDRFDINNSWAPAGWGVSDGEILKSGNPDAAASIGVTADGLGTLVDLVLEGSAVFADETSIPITGINVTAMSADGVALYNSKWGEFTRARALPSAEAGVEVHVDASGVVTSVTDVVGAGTIPDGTQVLVARDGTAAGQRLLALEPGDVVEIAYGIRDDAIDIQEAGGAWHRLLDDGRPVDNGSGSHFTTLHPRTVIGFSEDRRTAYFVVIDGRSQTAAGMQFTQMISLLQQLGAHDAISADGGGSTQMNVRRPGDATTSIMNTPADGIERRDGDGMGLVLAQPGSGQLTDIVVRTADPSADALRVFPGLHRTLVAVGVDETMTPLPSQPTTWTASDGAGVAPTSDVAARVQGVTQGVTRVAAAAGEIVAERELIVLNPLTRLTASESVVSLPDASASATVRLTGHDENGFEAPVEPVDVTVTGNEAGVLEVEDAGDGSFRLTSAVASGSATLTFTVGDSSVQTAVTVGIEERIVYTMDDIVADGWRTTGSRSTSSVAPGEGRDGGTSAHLTYDFSQETATRTANARPAAGHAGYLVPGQPAAVKVWVRGTTSTGTNPPTYFGYSDATGTFKYSYSAAPKGAEWEQITYAIPAGTAYPIRFQMISAYEPSAANLPVGQMWFDDPTAEVAPDVELPIVTFPTNDTIVADGATDDAPLRIAVMSDAQFVARSPESPQAKGAREALREIVAADPDALFINGDLVDEASVEDFALATRILDEELADADFPWTYIPGNHEVMGGDIANFRSAFGDTFTAADIEGTRFVTLNTATGRLASEFEQLTFLRDELDDAASDPSITGVVVLQHMPIDDPLVEKASQLADRRDAALQQDWLEEFREESGKSIALVSGHVGVFHAAQEDNIPYVINGNSGKSPTVADVGSFTGWTMLGIDPDAGDWRNDGKDIADDNAAWFAAEVQTRAESISIEAPEDTVELGATVALDATVVQDGSRRIDVAWPMSYAWTGGEGVFVGTAGEAPEGAIAVLDPVAQTLTGLSNGTAEVTLSINGVSQTAAITVGVDLDVQASATTRTLGGKKYISVTATNDEAFPVDIRFTSPFGTKSFTAVKPGGSVSVSFNSRATVVETGEVIATVTGVVGGETVTIDKRAAYSAG